MNRPKSEIETGNVSPNFRDHMRKFDVWNKSGEVIPPYACMRITDENNASTNTLLAGGIKFALQLLDDEHPYFFVSKPDEGAESAQNANMLLLNTENAIDINSPGEAFISYPCLTRFRSSSANADDFDVFGTLGPKDGQWEIDQDGSAFFGLSLDRFDEANTTQSKDEAMCWVRPNATGGGGGASLLTYTLTAAMTEDATPGIVGSATGNVVDIASNTATNGVSIEDLTGTAAHQIANDKGLAQKVNGRYIIIEPDCDFQSFNPSPS